MRLRLGALGALVMLSLGTVALYAQEARVFLQAVEIHRGRLLLGTSITQVFEGATNDDFETTLTVADPTADRTWTIPDAASDTFAGLAATQTLSNKTITASGAVTSSSASAGIGYATGAGGAVTQITSAATGVTLSRVTGQITTVALTTAAAVEERFTVTNTAVAATDVIVLGTTYNGAGLPMLSVVNVTAGSFDVVISNVHATNALNALMVINFAVVKAVGA